MYKTLQKINMWALVSFSSGDSSLAEEINLRYAQQQVSNFKGQPKIVLNVEVGRRSHDFWQKGTKKGFVEWEVSRKQTFCRAPHISAKLMGSNAWVKSTIPLMLLFSASSTGYHWKNIRSPVLWAMQEPHWLSSETQLPLIHMCSSWKMTQVKAVLELCTSNRLQVVCPCTSLMLGKVTMTVSL